MSTNPRDRYPDAGNMGATGFFLKSANTAIGSVGAPKRQEDPLISVLRGLAGGPRSLPHLVKLVGLGPTELAAQLEKLEAMRLVQRREEDGRFVFSIEAEGMAMLEAAA